MKSCPPDLCAGWARFLYAVSFDGYEVIIKTYKISGFIKDSNGNYLSGVAVQITNQSGQVIATVYTNTKGYYEVSGLAPGVYQVAAISGNRPSSTATIINQDVVVNLTIKVGGNKDPGGKPEDKPTKPEDKPTKPEDKPTKPEDKPQQPEQPNKTENTPQQPEEPKQPANTKGPEINIDDDPVPGDNKEPENPPAPDDDHKITGIVIDSDTEDPIPGVPVKIKDKDGNEVGPIDTEDDGTFTIPDLPDGEYKITVTYPDPINPINSITEEVTVIIDHSDEEVVIRLHIPKPTPEENHSIIGEVIDQNDKPLPGTTVDVYDAKGNKVGTTTTDKDGNFILSNLPNGTYTSVASYPTPLNPDGAVVTETVKVTISGEDEKITIRMNIDDTRTAEGIFKNTFRKAVMITAISLLFLLGIGLLWLLLFTWYWKAKIYNDTNTEEYKDSNYELVHKDYVDKEDKGVYFVKIPKKIVEQRKTDYFAVELNKLFVKRHNGDMLIVKIIDENNEDKVMTSYSFEIDKEENVITFDYDNSAETEN